MCASVSLCRVDTLVGLGVLRLHDSANVINGVTLQWRNTRTAVVRGEGATRHARHVTVRAGRSPKHLARSTCGVFGVQSTQPREPTRKPHCWCHTYSTWRTICMAYIFCVLSARHYMTQAHLRTTLRHKRCVATPTAAALLAVTCAPVARCTSPHTPGRLERGHTPPTSWWAPHK